MYHRIVSKGQAEYYYLKVSLEFDNGVQAGPIEATSFKAIIMESLQTMFGQVGKSIPVDVLKYDKESRLALIRVPGSGLVKLWSSMTICSQYAGKNCVFRVHQVSSHLMGLAVCSREMKVNKC